MANLTERERSLLVSAIGNPSDAAAIADKIDAGLTGTVSIVNGGTGQVTKAAAFDALQPMTTSGDIIYGGASGAATRLAKGADAQVLTLSSGLPVWANADPKYVVIGNLPFPTYTLDLSAGTFFEIGLVQNITLIFSNPKAGETYNISLSQRSSGSYTVAWPASVAWPNDVTPTLTTTVDQTDLVTLRYSPSFGGYYLGSILLNY